MCHAKQHAQDRNGHMSGLFKLKFMNFSPNDLLIMNGLLQLATVKMGFPKAIFIRFIYLAIFLDFDTKRVSLD